MAKAAQQSDGHREFHGHFAFDDVLKGLFENRPAADERCCHADNADVRERLPYTKPNNESG
jgi:hypothetical protein